MTHMTLLDWFAAVYLIAVKTIQNQALAWITGVCIAASLLGLFLLILGLVLYYRFHKRRRINNVAPSRNSVLGFRVDQERHVSMRRANTSPSPTATVLSEAILVENEVSVARNSSDRYVGEDRNQPIEYETIFPLPGRPIKPTALTFPRPTKPPRKPRRNEFPLMGSNAALSRREESSLPRLDGSGYLEVTESEGATYLTIVDDTESLPADKRKSVVSSETGIGDYLEMGNLELETPGTQRRAGRGVVETSYRDSILSDQYVDMNSGGIPRPIREEGYVDMNGEGEEDEVRTGGHASKFESARAMVASSFKRRENQGSREAEYSVMRNTGRVQSDAFYISIKPDGRISWTSDDEGYLKQRYQSESEGGIPSPNYIANPRGHTPGGNTSEPW